MEGKHKEATPRLFFFCPNLYIYFLVGENGFEDFVFFGGGGGVVFPDRF